MSIMLYAREERRKALTGNLLTLVALLTLVNKQPSESAAHGMVMTHVQIATCVLGNATNEQNKIASWGVVSVRNSELSNGVGTSEP